MNAANGDNGDGGDQIYAKKFTINPSSLIPTADGSCADSVTCIGTTINLKGTSTAVTGNEKYNWSLVSGTPNASNVQNPTIKYSGAGTYLAILTVNNGKATSKADTLKIVVKGKPSVSITPNTTPVTICKGDSVKLTANFNAAWKYTWTPGGNVTQVIMAKDTGLYSVTATDNNKCSGISNTIRIFHNQS